MGNVAFAARALCQGLEIPYVMPEKNNKGTLVTGAYYSPEEICLPFKIMMGNFLECIERGADTILFVGSCGPCRFGEYSELMMKILRKMEHDIDFIVFDMSPEIGIGEIRRRLGKVLERSPVSLARKLSAVKKAMKIQYLCDRLDRAAYLKAGYEARKGGCKRLLNEYKARLYECQSPEEALNILKLYVKKLASIEIDKSKKPIKIAIIGEIYTVIEPFSNLNIEEKLMDYGVSSERMLTPSWWVKDTVLKPLKLNSLRVSRAAAKYLPYPVGGHCKECVGEAYLAGKKAMDGAIQILPMGCMPEIIAKSILPTIQKDTNLPVLTLIVDEVTGEAGFITRVEAFLDMLSSRRKKPDMAS
jgi:predicted nucleotide-binding protein (sugar kinase/HSP70/actin superfamily)